MRSLHDQIAELQCPVMEDPHNPFSSIHRAGYAQAIAAAAELAEQYLAAHNSLSWSDADSAICPLGMFRVTEANTGEFLATLHARGSHRGDRAEWNRGCSSREAAMEACVWYYRQEIGR